MKLFPVCVIIFGAILSATAVLDASEKPLLCENTPTTRHCWGEYDLDTDYYTTTPNTGRTVEVWLSAEDGFCNLDGYRRPCLTFNGTVPGPTILADWGDMLVVHVTNNMHSNGTSVHWHGVRQLGSIEHDGVPGITQCPIAPGHSQTYRFRVTQYGSSWYHSHFSLQYSEGLFGGLIFRGPTTDQYDEDLGHVFMQDWSHKPAFEAFAYKTRYGITHSLDNLLINGTNSFDCSATQDVHCVGGGSKFHMVFRRGKRYLLRLINVSTDSQFQFSIDGHRLIVIANDLVPIVPYETESVALAAAQRYDVVVEANAEPSTYWLRAHWVDTCFGVANDHPESGTGIVRYEEIEDGGDTIPTSASTVHPPFVCEDEPYESLVPRLALDVTNIQGSPIVEGVNVRLTHAAWFQWTINSSSLVLDWERPTLQMVMDNETIFPTPYNVVAVDKSTKNPEEWVVLVIESVGSQLFNLISHPIHLHGHDFWVLAQGSGLWDGSIDGFHTKNPPRRDTARLPPSGYLAIAFKLDNPGTWILHCHIAWHASQGLAMEFVESQSDIKLVDDTFQRAIDNTCASWSKWWTASAQYPQLDSGI